MADPVTGAMAAVSIGSSILGGISGAEGANQKAQAANQMYQYQAGVALLNKQIADQNAAYAVATGESRAQQQGMLTRATIGQTKATQSASGLNINSGSAVDVRASEAELGAEDMATIRSNAAKEAYGFEVEGVKQTSQAEIDKMAGANALTAGKYDVASSILGTAGSVSSKWLGFKQQGIFGGTSSGGGASNPIDIGSAIQFS